MKAKPKAKRYTKSVLLTNRGVWSYPTVWSTFKEFLALHGYKEIKDHSYNAKNIRIYHRCKHEKDGYKFPSDTLVIKVIR